MNTKITSENWMNKPVLLLNSTYETLEHVPAERAVTLMVQGDADPVEFFTPEFHVRSQHSSIRLPRVVVMLRYVLVRHHVMVHDGSKATFAGVLRRDRNRCGYCGEYASTVDHVLPKSRGGPNTWGNLVAACFTCNNFKADRTPEEADMNLMWPPKVPRFDAKLQKSVWKEIALVNV